MLSIAFKFCLLLKKFFKHLIALLKVYKYKGEILSKLNLFLVYDSSTLACQLFLYYTLLLKVRVRVKKKFFLFDLIPQANKCFRKN